MKALLPLITWLALCPGIAVAQSPWYARDRWQLELDTGAMVFECQLRERRGDRLFFVEADSVRSLPLVALTGMRLLRPVDSLLRRHPPHS